MPEDFGMTACVYFRFLGILLQDIEQYTLAMDVVLNILDNFYEKFHLESLAVV